MYLSPILNSHLIDSLIVQTLHSHEISSQTRAVVQTFESALFHQTLQALERKKKANNEGGMNTEPAVFALWVLILLLHQAYMD